MTLRSPKLDDRTFNQLLAEAMDRIKQNKESGWTDLSPNDPGMVLLELFAHLTEVMLYRLNRLPEKAYIEFLRLIGLKLYPPSAANVDLTFSRGLPAAEAIEIPRGTRVTAERTTGAQETPIFTTAEAATIPPEQTEVTVRAYHCEQIIAELVGMGTGMGGQTVTVHRPPIIAPTGDSLDLLVAVEADVNTLEESTPAIAYEGKAYRVWREVDHFTNISATDPVYVADRNRGLIVFAPALRMQQANGDLSDNPTFLAAVPAKGQEIRIWYRRGGGLAGNVAEGKLTTLKDLIATLKVTNKVRATGGRPAETLDNALARGPQELHSLRRAVTAKDFESIALTASSRAIVRAKAFTSAELWKHAWPGQVEVLLVPDIPETERQSMTIAMLQAYETEAVRTQIQQTLDQRRPLGTACVVKWARYKQVKVHAKIVVRREEDKEAVKRRIIQRINQTIMPLPSDYSTTGWPFGQALRASHIYKIALAEPGVRWVEMIRMLVEEVPSAAVVAIASDYFQPSTWFVASNSTLFRSLNQGDGWEVIQRFQGPITAIETHPERAGWVAVVSKRIDNSGSQITVSNDCGETWQTDKSFPLTLNVNDLSWALRDGVPLLFLATDTGLNEISMQPGSIPISLIVDIAADSDHQKGLHAVVAYTDARGIKTVAVAEQSLGGVYLSNREGQSTTFRNITKGSLVGKDIPILAIQRDGSRAFLWAGAFVTDGGVGTGCYRWEMRGTEDPPEGWIAFSEGWAAGSCKGLAFRGTKVFAASYSLGILRLDTSHTSARWVAPAIDCGLPLREPAPQRLFYKVDAIAVSKESEKLVIMAGGEMGGYRSNDDGLTYGSLSNLEFAEKVTLPDTWLFVSSESDITIVSEDETR